MKTNQTNEFDIKALTWDDNPKNVERANAIAEKIKKLISIKPEMNGFEFGCGTGLLSINLQPYLNHLTLADNSEGMLNILNQKIQKNHIKNMEVIKTNLVNDEVPVKKYDIIYTAMTMHHIADLNSLFIKFFNMLNNFGYLAIADLDKEDGSFHGNGFNGHLGFERKEMKMIFETIGFRNVRSETCYKIVRKDEHGTEKTYPLFLMIGEK